MISISGGRGDLIHLDVPRVVVRRLTRCRPHRTWVVGAAHRSEELRLLGQLDHRIGADAMDRFPVLATEVRPGCS